MKISEVNTGIRKQQQTVSQQFPSDIQRLLGLYALLLAWPVLAIGVSVTFYLFIIIAYKVYTRYHAIFKVHSWIDYIFVGFAIVTLLSLILAPPLFRAPTFLSDVQIWLQYLYWILLVLFIKSYGRMMDWEVIMRNLFWGLNILIFCFFLIRISFSFSGVHINLGMSRNGFVFQMLCLAPLGLFYIWKTKGKPYVYLFSVLYLFCMLLSEGRAGSIILLFEIGVVFYIINPPLRAVIRYVLLPLLIVGVAIFHDYEISDEQKDRVAAVFEDYNPRLASLIRGEGEGDLTFDKSWLLRVLMVEKAMEIHNRYPWFGVGISHFTNYDANFSALRNDDRFGRLQHHSVEFYNTRSAHNSYVQILAETGVIGLVLLVLILLVPIVKFFYYIVARPSHHLLMITPTVAIAIHFYVISSITGAIGWFVIGISYFIMSSYLVRK